MASVTYGKCIMANVIMAYETEPQGQNEGNTVDIFVDNYTDVQSVPYHIRLSCHALALK